MKKPHIYAIVPLLSSEVGHFFQYHVSVQKAFQALGGSYTPLVPKGARIHSMPPNWLNILADDRSMSRKSFFYRLKILLSNFFILRRFFATLKNQSETVVFFESFELQHLASIFLALLCTRSAIQFWFMHRFVLGKFHYKTLIYRFFHWFLEFRLGRNNVRYLTDSELLAQEQQKVFKRNIFVLPIPHAQDIFFEQNKKNEELLLWWPGGSIRQDKGLFYIQRIAEMIRGKKKIKLIVAEKAKELLPDHSQIHLIPAEISRAEYVQWMRQSNLILLPYSSIDYVHRTSGIFVEAVSLGALPVTTQGTWMAHELKKFGLDCLAIDWNRDDLIDYLTSLPSNQNIIERLKIMRTAYHEYHSEKKFGEAFACLANL
jgi:hypothetical protein